jgi:hypothetical protein
MDRHARGEATTAFAIGRQAPPALSEAMWFQGSKSETSASFAVRGTKGLKGAKPNGSGVVREALDASEARPPDLLETSDVHPRG